MSSVWARTWGRLTAPTGNLTLALRAYSEGDLQAAVEYAKKYRFDTTSSGRRFLKNLVASLIEKSREQVSTGNYLQAWILLANASEIVVPRDSDLVSREQSELVELTIDHAESLLTSGKIAHAAKMIDELYSRKILDWRADRIRAVTQKIRDAEVAAAQGEFAMAIQHLGDAHQLRPDLLLINSRLTTYRLRQTQVKELTDSLHDSLLKGDWTVVSRICNQLLVIAPSYEIALNAQRRLIDIRKRKTHASSRKTSYDSTRSDHASPAERITSVVCEELSINEKLTSSTQANESPFMLWIDGVGGYLVCPAALNTIGQAITHSNVQIPILGDLQRRHCRIKTVNQDHLLYPLGNISVDGQKTVHPMPLKNHQLIELEGGVNLRYSKPHPLSGSARLEFCSRHRTQPWSDSVLLASGPIILGPSRRNHVYCPRWAGDLVLFQRDGNWYARTDGKLEIDGKVYEREGPLKLDSRIENDEFTMSLEPVAT